MTKQKILIFSLSAMFFLTASLVAYSFTEPTTMPSSYNPPINTSTTPQTKLGALTFPMMYDSDGCNAKGENCPYYINPSGNSVVSGTISAANPTDSKHLATKEYVDSMGSPIISKYFGSGMDKDVIISTNTTLTKDMEYKNLTIKSGATLNPNGWRLFVSDTLTIESGGKISRDGNNGGGFRNCTMGTGLATNRVGGSASGGYASLGCGAHVGCSYTQVPGDNGEFGSGGNGGSANGYSGSAGGSGSNVNVVLREYIDPPSQSQLALLPSLTLAKLGGGGGGGGGGDDWEFSCLGGKGGSGGGIIHIFAKNIINNGLISARGGNGGDGGSSEKFGGYPSGGGGGGGGGGGYILVVYNTKTGEGDLDVSGGNGGSGGSSAAYTAGFNGGSGRATEYQVNF